MTKDDTISKVDNDLAGFGSLQKTLADAKEVDPSITLDDIKQWTAENTKTKKQLPRQNTFVANEPHNEYQLDLRFIEKLGRSAV